MPGLSPEGPDVFAAGPFGARFRFQRGQDGRVTGFVLSGPYPVESVRFTKLAVPGSGVP